MRKFNLLLSLLLTMLMVVLVMPLNAQNAETFFKDYLGKTIAEVITAEGPPDDITQRENIPDENDITSTETMLKYDHKIIVEREYTIRYWGEDEIVNSVEYTSNSQNAEQTIEPDCTWTLMSDIGKTRDKIFNAWGPADIYAHFTVGRPEFPYEEQHMFYRKVNINGHTYNVSFAFDNNRVLYIIYSASISMTHDKNVNYLNATMNSLLEMLNEPAWVRHEKNWPKSKTPNDPSFIFRYNAVDETYLIDMYGNVDNSAQTLNLSISIFPHNTENRPILLPLFINTMAMIENWNSDGVIKGGGFEKIDNLQQKLEATVAKLTQHMPEYNNKE